MLQSVDRKYDFTAFYTKNNYFPENFSFGLVYVSRNEIGKVPIIRCNGLHGPTNAWEHHSYTHSHKPTVEGLNAGNKEGTLIERLEEYSTFETAMPYFGNVIKANEIDRIKYFPSPNVVKQTDLFSGPQ